MSEIENLKIDGGSTYTVGNQDIVANEWEASKTYVKGKSYVIREHRLYVCNVTHTSVEPFDPDNWTEITVGEAIAANTTAIGDLSTLTTTDKSSLVGAVNEVNKITDYTDGLSYHPGVTRYLGSVYKQGKIVICSLTLKIEQNINNNETVVSGLPTMPYRSIKFPCMVGTDQYLIGNSDGALYMQVNSTVITRWGNLTATTANPKYMTMMFAYITT